MARLVLCNASDLEYKKCKISKEQEQEWIQEYQNDLLMRIKNEKIIGPNFNNLCSSIRQYKDVNVLEKLVKTVIELEKTLDSFSLVLLSEGILNIVDSFERSNLGNHMVTIFSKKTALSLLKSLLEKPIVVADKYLNESFLTDLHDKQTIINRIQDDLTNWRYN